jgi:hypothetical protein
MPHRQDDPETMARMRRWLRAVAEEAGVDPEAMGPVEAPLLDLVSRVAHGPSRPGAPLTTFLVGLAAGRGADVGQLVAAVSRLAADFDPGDPADPA